MKKMILLGISILCAIGSAITGDLSMKEDIKEELRLQQEAAAEAENTEA